MRSIHLIVRDKFQFSFSMDLISSFRDQRQPEKSKRRQCHKDEQSGYRLRGSQPKAIETFINEDRHDLGVIGQNDQ